MRRSLHHVLDPSRLQKYLKRKVPNFLLNDIKNNEYNLVSSQLKRFYWFQ